MGMNDSDGDTLNGILPDNVITYLFEVCTAMNYPRHTPVLVSSVCHRWHQLAIQAQKLWSYIDLTEYKSTPLELNQRIELGSLFLDRSGGSPLDVTVTSGLTYQQRFPSNSI